MPTLSVKVADFLNRSQTKIRSLATYLNDNFDIKGYQSPDSDRALIQIYEFRQFNKLLLSYNYGGLTPKQVSDYIDYFTWWGQLSKLNLVSYSTYQSIVQENVTVPSGQYALQVDLLAEVGNRQAGDSALSARVTVLENNQLDPSTIFPPHFFDNPHSTNVNVWDDDSRLHTHSNKTQLDQITSQFITWIAALGAHYASSGNPSGIHVSSDDRTNWNNKVDPSVIAGLSTVYAPYSHIQSGADKHTIDEITNLQATIDAMNAAILDMAGVDGKSVELQRVGDNLQWRLVGDPTWIDLGSIKGDQGDQGDPFTINARGNDDDRFNSMYDSANDQFTFLAFDTGRLYYRQPSGGSATTSGGWSDPILFIGQNGWSPVFALFVVDSSKTVLQLVDWVGGSGDKPVLDPGASPPTPVRWFVGAGGLTLDVTQAVNVKGPIGDTGSGPIIGGSGNLAGRAAFDSQLKGFIYLRTDILPNVIYQKQSGASGDWSAALPWQGPPGAGINRTTVITTGGTITLDLAGNSNAFFVGSASISGAKTLAIANYVNGTDFTFKFVLAAVGDWTLPTSSPPVKMPVDFGEYISGNKWSPSRTGSYVARFTYDGSEVTMEISGPF